MGRFARRRVIRVSLVRGVRERGLGPVRRTVTCGELLGRFGLGRSRITRQISGDEATIAGSVELLGLGSEIRRVVVSSVVDANRTETLLTVRSRRRRCVLTGGVFSRGLDIHRARGLIGTLGGPGGRRGGPRMRGRFMCAGLRRRVGDLVNAGMDIRTGTGKGKGVRVRCCSPSSLREVCRLLVAVRRGWGKSNEDS